MKPRDILKFSEEEGKAILEAYKMMNLDNRFRALTNGLLLIIAVLLLFILIELKKSQIPRYGDFRIAESKEEKIELMNKRPMIKTYE